MTNQELSLKILELVGGKENVTAATNCMTRLRADFVAAELRLSKSYIQNMFSQSMHIGLKQYIMQKKVLAAHSDMMSGMSASDASAKYAFTDYSVFFRLYKKILGYPPRMTKQKNS